MKKILVTGNPDKDGLAKGIRQALAQDFDLTFISLSNGWPYAKQSAIEKLCFGFDVFINCSKFYQLETLDTIYRTWDTNKKSSLIVNIGSTSTFWQMDPVNRFWEEKRVLEETSKRMSHRFITGASTVRASYIAFGRLGKQEWRDHNVKGIDLEIAGNIIKNVIDLPDTYNMQYVAVDAFD